MYVVFEIQTGENDAVGTLVTSYNNRPAAESAYHSVLASAAVSALKCHAAMLMTEEGFVLKSECYRHDVIEQHPDQPDGYIES